MSFVVRHSKAAAEGATSKIEEQRADTVNLGKELSMC
jgi:hypothetical protein